MSIWTRLHQLVNRMAAARCKHLKGTVCIHNYYNHDEWARGFSAGNLNGSANVTAKWLGSVTGEGPYANYPAPTQAHLDMIRAARRS